MDELFKSVVEGMTYDTSADTKREIREEEMAKESAGTGWDFTTYLKCAAHYKGSYIPPKWVMDLCKKRNINPFEPRN